MIRIVSWLFIGLITFSSCEQRMLKSEVSRYYSLNQLIDEQVILLARSNASLEKKGSIGENSDDSSLQGDSTFWANQLEIFRGVDLNKPTLIDSYEIIRDVPSQTSNLMITSYRPVDPAKTKVKRFDIYYLDSIDKLKIIEVEESFANELYGSTRNFRLIFDQQDGENVLKSYSIMGIQKMVSSDSVEFTIEGTIKL